MCTLTGVCLEGVDRRVERVPGEHGCWVCVSVVGGGSSWAVAEKQQDAVRDVALGGRGAGDQRAGCA